jgi:hypothetical protein
LRDVIDEIQLTDEKEVEQAKADLVGALESIRRYRELVEKKG